MVSIEKTGIMSASGEINENLVCHSDVFRTGSHANGVTPSVNADGTYQVIAATGNSNYSSSWQAVDALNNVESSFTDGDPFTVSFWIKSDDCATTNPPRIYLKPGMGYYSMIGKVTSQYSQVYYSGTWKSENALVPHLGWSGLSGTYTICHWKIEKGSVPTPWVPNELDDIYTGNINGFIETADLSRISEEYIEGNNFYEY